MKNRFFLLFPLLIIVLNIHAQSPSEIEYLFPIPGTGGHPKETVIILRYKNYLPSQIINLKTCMTVSGTKSGPVKGITVISTDGKTLIFKPNSHFTPGERVQVRLNPVISNYQAVTAGMAFDFTIMLRENPRKNETSQIRNQMTYHSAPDDSEKQDNGDPVVMNGVSVPSDFPHVKITVNDNPDTGYIFLNTSWNSYPHYSMILDNTGAPVWYIRSYINQQDLKVQPDGRLTMLTNLPDLPGFEYIAMDTTYTVVDTFHVPPGYYGEEHELQVLGNGHYLLIAKNDSIIDMSQLIDGGNPQANVVGNSVVEMDSDDNPVFIWRSWDHFNILDAVHENLHDGYIDYVHMNAIDVDHDGHILVSSRHLSEVTKINRQTGEIIWRLGGENDYFNWENDDGQISYQHDIRVLSNGNYTIFDNGLHRYPYYSRAMEFSVDTTNWTVTKVWEYPEAHDIFTGWMGNAQRLPNGNTVICWADNSLPKFTEVRPDGSKAFELDFIQSHASYRAFRFPWCGNAAVPYLLIEYWTDHITLFFNKFGDSDVSAYRIYGGTSPEPDRIIATTSQPFIHLSSELQNKTNYFFRVTALNSQEQESGFSNQEEIYIDWTEPGEEMVYNGDFSEGFNYWHWGTYDDGQGYWTIDNGELHIHIQNGSSEIWHLQLTQPNILLIYGKIYLFEFDAYADAGRTVQFEIKKDSDPWTNYSKKGDTWLTTQKTHHSHEFVMEYFSENHARIELNLGTSPHDVYIDNVSLKEAIPSTVGNKRIIPDHYVLMNGYPNPFNSETAIQYSVPVRSHIHINIFDILGNEVNAQQFNKEPGLHTFRLNADNLSSGIYFFRMRARSENKVRQYQGTRKLMLIK